MWFKLLIIFQLQLHLQLFFFFSYFKVAVLRTYTVSQKNRTLVIFSNISNKSGPILIIFGTENRQ